MPSFKVPCPSCEAQVLIKNPDLVGTKVECPKCKYRFKVETPAGEPPKDAAKDDKKDAKKDGKEPKAKGEKKAKAKTKGGNKKAVGIGLAVAAVALLGVGGYMVFGGGGDSTKPPGGGGGGGRVAGGTNNTGNPDGGGEEVKGENDDSKKKAGPPPEPAAPRSTKEPTNLLPTQAVAVYRFDLGKLRQTPVGGMLFDAATADLVKSSMGFELSDIDQYFHCTVGVKERTPFGLIRLKEPVAEKKLAARVAGAAAPRTVGGKAFIPVAANPLLSAAGSALAGRTLLADVYDVPPPAPKGKAPPLAVCVYDTQTVLVGDAAALEQHVGGFKDGYPEFQTAVQKDDPPPPPAPTPGAGDMPTPMLTPVPAPPPAPAAPSKKAFTSNPTYLSLDPKLRVIVLTMEAEPTGAPMFCLAEQFDNTAYPRAGVKKEYAPIATALDPVLERTEYVGANLTVFNPRQVAATLRFFGKSDSDARIIALEKLTPTLSEALPVLSLLLQTYVEFRNQADPTYVNPNDPAFQPGIPFGPGGVQPGPGPGPGTTYPMPGVSPPPGSSRPPRGAGPGPGPGSPLPGPVGPPMGRPGYPSGPGVEGEGIQPGLPGDPNQPARTNVPASHVTLRLTDNAVTVAVDVTWPEDTYARLLGPRLLGFVNQLKGKAAVYAGTETWHALGRAVKQYVGERKAFPPGTVPVSRQGDYDVRFGVPYPPAQRASFFVELLPALGRGGVRQMIDPALGWTHERNAPFSGSWVPELLVTYYPQTAWRATSPLAPDHTFGGTNFVAVAGVGRNAPRFDLKNPAQAKEAGITGYEWGSKVEDVTDGLENTIYLIQSPPGVSRPWAAGGGATVVGLDPTDPMAAFKHTRPDGQEGTYAVMGDGTVRWLPATIDAKVFLGMATRAGGEKLPNLDEVAPKVLPPGAKLVAEVKADPTPAKTEPMPKGTGAKVEPAAKGTDPKVEPAAKGSDAKVEPGPSPAPTPAPTTTPPAAPAPMPREKGTDPAQPKN
jgi:DNA-directed RNA polymerase subunit M/transcription elongation factor TFIIS